MAAWVSTVFLRWYRAFNTAANSPESGAVRPWNEFQGEVFPFVEVPISSRVCTVVGANEAGKSHLLAAIEKVLNGKTALGQAYTTHDICRYCGLLTSQRALWPELGLEFSFDTMPEAASCIGQLGFTSTPLPEGRLRVFINGGVDDYARFYDSKGVHIGSMKRSDWRTKSAVLPKVRFVHANLKFSNQVHINQLIAQYQSKKANAFEPVQLQTLASELLSFDITAAVAEASAPDNPKKQTPHQDTLRSLQERLTSNLFETGSGGLECILFRDILGIPVSILEEIRDLNSKESGYVEQLVEDMNHRLSETLDVSEFWQQDEDFTLLIEYKAGFFYFFIRDRTGSKYTFNERSGGLKYFLSYYVQAKAIRDAMGNNGAVIVMDEPDGFLSAAGQRNLLSVFELLAQPADVGDVKRRCQVIYTTHSPFLINRNYPDRISLLRKGDGGEGTQHVELVSTRQYEPVRSGLGIEAAETLFMGAENVVLEGVSEQRLLVAAIQRFGDAERIDDMLDLNRVAVVSASGDGDVARLLKATKRSAEKRPVTVVLLDGDKAGKKAVEELVGEKLIQQHLIGTIADSNLPTSGWNLSPETLEDLVPPRLLALAIAHFIGKRWNRDAPEVDAVVKEWERHGTETSSARLVSVVRGLTAALAESVDDISLKAGVYESLSRMLVDDDPELAQYGTELQELEEVFRKLCSRLRTMLAKARTEAKQDRLKKSVRLEVERFLKIHSKDATKADVRRCLLRLESHAVGSDDRSRLTRENIRKLNDLNDSEVRHAGFKVNAATWRERLEALKQAPWGKGEG